MSVEKIEKITESAKKENLFQRRREVVVGGKKYVIRKPTRKEMFDSGVQFLFNFLDDLRKMIERENDVEKRKTLLEKYNATQYEYEKKLLLLCVENLSEKDLDEMDYGEWYALIGQVNEMVFLSVLQEYFKGRGSSQSTTLATL